MEQGTLAAYKEDGVEKYQILATLDSRTSEVCRDEDGEIYEIDKAVTGVNYPPYHPFAVPLPCHILQTMKLAHELQKTVVGRITQCQAM